MVTHRAQFLNRFQTIAQKSLGARQRSANFRNLSQQRNRLLHLKGVEPVDGVSQLIQDLSQCSAHLALLSSLPKLKIQKFLDRTGLHQFATIRCNLDSRGRVRQLKSLCHEWGFKGQEVYYVADEVGDISIARSAGVRIVSASWGRDSREQLTRAFPDVTLHEPKELMVLLNTLVGLGF